MDYRYLPFYGGTLDGAFQPALYANLVTGAPTGWWSGFPGVFGGFGGAGFGGFGGCCGGFGGYSFPGGYGFPGGFGTYLGWI